MTRKKTARLGRKSGLSAKDRANAVEVECPTCRGSGTRRGVACPLCEGDRTVLATK